MATRRPSPTGAPLAAGILCVPSHAPATLQVIATCPHVARALVARRARLAVALLALVARRARLALALLALVLGGALACPRPAQAQATAADTAAILLQAAGRLSAEGRGEAAAAVLDYVRLHYPATPAGEEAARRLAAAPAAPVRGAAARGQTGRTELIVWGTTYGIGLGLMTPAALDANSPTAYGLGLLLGAPTGYIVSRMYADRVGITEGAARAITFGGTWGGWQGYGLARVAGLLDHKDRICPTPDSCFETSSTSGKAVVRSLVVGSLAGIAAGAAMGQAFAITPGAATTVNLAALWGTAYGGASAVLIDATKGHTPLVLTLIGGDAALLGAAATAPVWRLTRERARLISIAGLAGALAGGGIDLILRVDNDKVAIGIPMATAGAGLLLGAITTASMPREALAPGGSRRPAEGAPGGALLGVRDGRIDVGMPAATPVLLPARGGRLGTGLYVPVLAARF